MNFDPKITTGQARSFVWLMQQWGVRTMNGVNDAMGECRDDLDFITVNFKDGTSISLRYEQFPYPSAAVNEAVAVLSKQYPGIQYVSEMDQFLYRGQLFGYFQSGMSISGPNCYLLRNPTYSSVWLYTYGEPEVMWQKYLDDVKKASQ